MLRSNSMWFLIVMQRKQDIHSGALSAELAVQSQLYAGGSEAAKESLSLRTGCAGDHACCHIISRPTGFCAGKAENLHQILGQGVITCIWHTFIFSHTHIRQADTAVTRDKNALLGLKLTDLTGREVRIELPELIRGQTVTSGNLPRCVTFPDSIGTRCTLAVPRYRLHHGRCSRTDGCQQLCN